MAVNLYDSPAQAQFLNTYVPIPFQEIVSAGQSKQQRYDVNRAGFERMSQEAEDLYAIPTSEDEAYIRNVVGVMQDLSDKYATSDYGNPEVINEINRTIRQNINRRQVQEIQQSYAAWQQNQKNIAQLKAQQLYDPELDQSYKGYNTSTNGIYTYLTPASIDIMKEARAYFDDWYGNSFVDKSSGVVYEGYRNAKGAQKIVDDVYRDFLQTPAGKQLITKTHSEGASQEQKEQIAKGYLMDVSKEFYRQGNIGFVPEWTAGVGDKDKQLYPSVTPSFFSSEERFPEQYSSYSKAKKAVNEYRDTRKQLESNLVVAKQNGDPTAIANAEASLQALDNQNAGLEQIYSDIYNRASKGQNKRILAYQKEFNTDLAKKGFTQEQIEKISSVAMDYYKDKGAFDDFFEFGPSFKEKYVEKYGPNDDVIKDNKVWNSNISKIERAGGFLRANLSKVYEDIDSKAEQMYDAEVSKGISREYFSFPVDNESKKIQTITGREVASNAYRVAEQLKLNANSFEIEPITGGGTLNDDERGDLLNQAYDAGADIKITGTSPSDSKYGYIVITVNDSKGNPVTDGNKHSEFKVYLNSPSQMQAIAMDYAMQGNTDLAIRFAQPAIEKQVEKAFETPARPNSITINVLGENVNLIRDNDSKDTYYLQTPSGAIPLEGREEIKTALYTLMQPNLNQQ